MTAETEIPATILLVDDPPSSMGVALKAWEDAGYQVAIATSGEKVPQRAAVVTPDLILLDVFVPEMGRLRSLPPAEGSGSHARHSHHFSVCPQGTHRQGQRVWIERGGLSHQADGVGGVAGASPRARDHQPAAARTSDGQQRLETHVATRNRQTGRCQRGAEAQRRAHGSPGWNL